MFSETRKKFSACLKKTSADESILWQTYRKSLLLIWTRSASPCSPGRRVGSQISAHPFHNCFSSLYQTSQTWRAICCISVSYRHQGKSEIQMPEAKFQRMFSSITLTSLLESLWKLLASTDPHMLLCSTGDGHHKHQQSQKSTFMPTALLQLVFVTLNLRTVCFF